MDEAKEWKKYAEAQSDTFIAAYLETIVTIPGETLTVKEIALVREAAKRLYHAEELKAKKERNGW